MEQHPVVSHFPRRLLFHAVLFIYFFLQLFLPYSKWFEASKNIMYLVTENNFILSNK